MVLDLKEANDVSNPSTNESSQEEKEISTTEAKIKYIYFFIMYVFGL